MKKKYYLCTKIRNIHFKNQKDYESKVDNIS